MNMVNRLNAASVMAQEAIGAMKVALWQNTTVAH